MRIKIDESVLRKTDVFCRILDDANKRNNIAPNLSCGIIAEYKGIIPQQDEYAISTFDGLGICLRGDHIVKHPVYKTPDLVTGGFLAGTTDEAVYLAECKFNSENPANNFLNIGEFRRLVADKFQVINADIWNIYAPKRKFFVIFPYEKVGQAKSRMRALQRASEGEELALTTSFTICDLTEFREYFA